MRLLELEINCFRGIRHLKVQCDGDNLVVWGPNGSGKSTVVDALDFLLTGSVSRLTGEGTGAIHLEEHGPHIDSEPAQAWVRGLFKVGDPDTVVELKRCIDEPDNLIASEDDRQLIAPHLVLAKRGQHVLTRREILKYVTSLPSTRAEQIGLLLNISEVNDIRKALVNVKNECRREVQISKASVKAAERAISTTIQAKSFSEDALILAINKSREVLGGAPIEVANSSTIKQDLVAPAKAGAADGINLNLLERDLDTLASATEQRSVGQGELLDRELRQLILQITSDAELLTSLQRRELTEKGLLLLDESGSCPLCETPWPEGELRELLEQRLKIAETAYAYQKRISDSTATMVARVDTLLASIEQVSRASKRLKLTRHDEMLAEWAGRLRTLKQALSQPLDRYLEFASTHDVASLLAPEDCRRQLNEIRTEARKNAPSTTPQQDAWDILTRLEENIRRYELAIRDQNKAIRILNRAESLLATFEKNRDEVLSQLYDSVNNKFCHLYKLLHGPDEGEFTSQLRPEGPALHLEVDFYGRGLHPPGALHSEGHQDSMGLCLYLALAERLTKGVIDLIILDDVVMSVDADHRRSLCRVLAKEFPNRQFLITTHDRTWQSQLKSEGVVKSKGVVEFYSWTLGTGPRVNSGKDIWAQIRHEIDEGNIPTAAFLLRRGSEEFFFDVCVKIGAQVRLRADAKYDLGELMPAAVGRYRKLVGRAKNVANSWNDNELMTMLNERDATMSQIYSRTQAEQWAVNVNVHFNNWTNFAPEDFRPVAEAFHDLHLAFTCPQCKSVLSIASLGPEREAAVRCTCGKHSWNLVAKKMAA